MFLALRYFLYSLHHRHRCGPDYLVQHSGCIGYESAIGARFVARLPEKKIQLGMGIALIVVALVMIIRQLGLMPPGGEATGLVGWRLVAAIVGCFIIGAVMTIGIGNYGFNDGSDLFPGNESCLRVPDYDGQRPIS